MVEALLTVAVVIATVALIGFLAMRDERRRARMTPEERQEEDQDIQTW